MSDPNWINLILFFLFYFLFFSPPIIQIVKYQICPVKDLESQTQTNQKFAATMYLPEDLKDISFIF